MGVKINWPGQLIYGWLRMGLLPPPREICRHVISCRELKAQSLKKYYQKRRPVTGFKHIRLLHGNVPALSSEIVTAFWKKEKVSALPHLPYSLDLALCDFFIFPKLK